MAVKILFVDVPAIQLDHLEKAIESGVSPSYAYGFPLGILYLSSYIKKQHPDTETALVDYPSRLSQITDYKSVTQFISEIARESASFEPDVIAFSAIFSSCHPFLMRCVELIKEIWPNAVSILGGMHPSNLARKMLEHKDIDYVAKGEGELSFAKFVGEFQSEEREKIKGIYSQKSSELIIGELLNADFIDDLDEIPLPDWDLMDMEYFVSEGARSQVRVGSAELDKKTAIIMTTRGCPFRCTFCSSHSVHGRKMRYRSVENVIQEVSILYEKFGVTRFVPEDDLFTAHKTRVVALLGALRALKIPDFEIQFPNALSPMVLSKTVMDALVDSGMKLATISVDSGSVYTQKYIVDRRTDLTRTREVIDYLKNNGIIVRCNFIIGFPGETLELMQETIDYAKSIAVDWVHIGMAMPLVGSQMYQDFVDRGDIEDNEKFWSVCDFDRRSFDTQEISAKDLMELTYRANLDINFIHNPNLKSGNYARVDELFTDVVSKHPFHIFGWYALKQAHKKRNNLIEENETQRKIIKLIKTNSRSKKLYNKYGDLLPAEFTALLSHDVEMKMAHYAS